MSGNVRLAILSPNVVDALETGEIVISGSVRGDSDALQPQPSPVIRVP